ncbi:MAG: hypothetical protein ACXWZS_00910 [Gemmatirosa sp.]
MSDAPDPSAADPSPSAPAPDARARLDTVLRPYALGTHAADAGPSLTEQRVAAVARDASAAVLPLLGDPPRSAHRVRLLLRPVLTCTWAEFEATYEETLDALLALPPARADVEDPAWDVALPPAPAARRAWMPGGPRWTAPMEGAATVGPAGTPGRIVRRGSRTVLLTSDGRSVQASMRCTCDAATREARPAVLFEIVHFRRDGAILDVVAGTACGACRAVVP